MVLDIPDRIVKESMALLSGPASYRVHTTQNQVRLPLDRP